MTQQTDNPNFFDDLERQLVAATSERPRRLRRARRRSIATLCTVLVAVLAVGGGLAAALSNTNNDNSARNAPAAPQPQRNAPPAAATPAHSGRCGRDTGTANGGRTIDPSSIEVAVLNGTTVPGLARGVANRLHSSRWKIGTVTNAPTQDETETRVYYGRAACKAAAMLVAQAIDLQDITRGTRSMHTMVAIVAGQSADVAVVVGSDQNLTRP
jgi:hypothetical protein